MSRRWFALDTMESHGVLGVSVAIIDDYEVVCARGFGYAEPGRPVDTDTLFQAASLTKPVSAVVAAAAAEEGLVDLGADVTEMLTSWRLPPMPYDGPVTLRLLLAHRAGTNVPGFPGYRLEERLPDLAQILSGVRDKNEPIRVVGEPGARRDYSGGERHHALWSERMTRLDPSVHRVKSVSNERWGTHARRGRILIDRGSRNSTHVALREFGRTHGRVAV
jgi:hypothetical protein